MNEPTDIDNTRKAVELVGDDEDLFDIYIGASLSRYLDDKTPTIEQRH